MFSEMLNPVVSHQTKREGTPWSLEPNQCRASKISWREQDGQDTSSQDQTNPTIHPPLQCLPGEILIGNVVTVAIKRDQNLVSFICYEYLRFTFFYNYLLSINYSLSQCLYHKLMFNF